MKILHTSDLHLGKKLDGITRLDEQKEVLNEIIDIAVQEKVQVVLIAGDVFDSYIPSADAENLFFDTLDNLSSRGMSVVCISGNHDDEDRLLASKCLASKHGVYLCGENNDFLNREFNKIKVERCGANYIVLNDGKEKVFIATVPYFGEAPIGYAVDKEQSFTERTQSILKSVFDNKTADESGVLLTHLFMLGGCRTEGERDIDLGGVKVVSPKAIPEDCLYVALGHLHKRQVISNAKTAIYSGSPLQYSYDEANIEKSVTIFEIEGGKLFNLKEIPLKTGKKLAVINCNIENIDDILSKNTDKYVDLNIISDRPLLFEETAEIKSKYPNVTKIRLELSGVTDSGTVVGRKNLSEKELFIEFYKRKFGSAPDEELLSAYLEIMSEE